MDYRYPSTAASRDRSRSTTKDTRGTSAYTRTRAGADRYPSNQRPPSQNRRQAEYPQRRQVSSESPYRRQAGAEYSQRRQAGTDYPQRRQAGAEYPQRRRPPADSSQERRTASNPPQRRSRPPKEASRQTRDGARRRDPRSEAARRARIRQKKKRLLAALLFKGILFLLACVLFVSIFLKARSGDSDAKNQHGILPQDFVTQQTADAELNQTEPQTAPQATDAPPSSSDTEAPIVSADDIYVTAGGVVSYKKAIQAYDNVDSSEELTLDVNNSQVDLNTVGDYPYTATVTDRGGNSAQASAMVHVLEAGTPTADIDQVNALADQILAEILNDNMLPKEKLRAIYDWIQSETHYEGHSQEDDVVLAAYVGFTEHTGNCFTYMAQAKFLLTRAGIENLVVTKVVPEGSTDIPTHYWNLVNIGEGWYHYDPTPRRNRRDFFYLTDAELMEYSDAHEGYGTHVYDPSLYPKIE